SAVCTALSHPGHLHLGHSACADLDLRLLHSCNGHVRFHAPGSPEQGRRLGSPGRGGLRLSLLQRTMAFFGMDLALAELATGTGSAAIACLSRGDAGA